MPLRVHYLQHVAFEGLGRIGSWAEAAGATVTATRFYANQPLPALDAFDVLVIMGGPMRTHETERHPWLAREKRFIREAIAAEKAILGICLGAQLIADVLGARVYPNDQREIGWFDIQRTRVAADHAIGRCLPPRIKVFHWHRDTFDLPDGAHPLARSAACRHQAYAVGERVVGLQFHLETTPESLQALIENCSDDLSPGPYVQTPHAMQSTDKWYGPNYDVLDTILIRLTSALRGGA